jgi:hypothetical protein
MRRGYGLLPGLRGIGLRPILSQRGSLRHRLRRRLCRPLPRHAGLLGGVRGELHRQLRRGRQVRRHLRSGLCLRLLELGAVQRAGGPRQHDRLRLRVVVHHRVRRALRHAVQQRRELLARLPGRGAHQLRKRHSSLRVVPELSHEQTSDLTSVRHLRHGTRCLLLLPRGPRAKHDSVTRCSAELRRGARAPHPARPVQPAWSG